MSIFIHERALVEKGALIGDGTKIWQGATVRSGAQIGKNCIIGQGSYIAPTAQLGDNVKLEYNSPIFDGVILEDDVFIGPNAIFTNIKNPRSHINRHGKFEKTHVKKGASIGANATILCGITLGSFCLIGAGTIVTKNVDDYALIVGNPGKQVGWVCRCAGEEKVQKLVFTEGKASCTHCGQYELKNEKVYEVQ